MPRAPALVCVLLACTRPAPVVPRPARAALLQRAVLPAATFDDGPASGRLLDGRSQAPWPHQPVQGFSSLQLIDGAFVTISDNGYGVPETSSDFRLVITTLVPDFVSGQLRVGERRALTDPARHVPWPIVHEDDPARPLTGADLDPESLVRAPDGTFWVGDEQGPFLLHLDADGRVLEPPFPLVVDGGLWAGPDAPWLRENLLLRSMEALRTRAREAGARPPTLSPDHRWLTSPEQLRALHAAGFVVVPWTVNEPERLEALFAWGLDGVITDRPDLAHAFLDAGRPVHGHRGARGLAPESTPAAFIEGLRAGASVLEFDVSATADDEALVWHDARLMAPKCRDVPDGGLLLAGSSVTQALAATCDGLLPEFPAQRRDAGSRRPLTLRDALRLPGRLNIETKVHGTGLPHDDPAWLTRLLLRRVAEADAGARVMLQSFDWRALEVAWREAPWLETVALFGERTALAPPPQRSGLGWPERPVTRRLGRSAGFESLAVSPDGRSLVALLEKPAPGDSDCLAFRFDLSTKAWAGVAFRLPLCPGATAIGDLAIVDERLAWVLERDDAEGEAAKVKRLVRVELPTVHGARAQPVPAADLLSLGLPDGGSFRFPFWTIEGVAALPDGTVAILNDNNFPFGRARSAEEPDDTELIVVHPGSR